MHFYAHMYAWMNAWMYAYLYACLYTQTHTSIPICNETPIDLSSIWAVELLKMVLHWRLADQYSLMVRPFISNVVYLCVQMKRVWHQWTLPCSSFQVCRQHMASQTNLSIRPITANDAAFVYINTRICRLSLINHQRPCSERLAGSALSDAYVTLSCIQGFMADTWIPHIYKRYKCVNRERDLKDRRGFVMADISGWKEQSVMFYLRPWNVYAVPND